MYRCLMILLIPLLTFAQDGFKPFNVSPESPTQTHRINQLIEKSWFYTQQEMSESFLELFDYNTEEEKKAVETLFFKSCRVFKERYNSEWPSNWQMQRIVSFEKGYQMVMGFVEVENDLIPDCYIVSFRDDNTPLLKRFNLNDKEESQLYMKMVSRINSYKKVLKLQQEAAM